MIHRDDRYQVKGFMAKTNKALKLKHVKVFVESAIIKVTACRNGNICIEGRRIHYLIPVCVSQSEITRTTCICLLQDHTLTGSPVVMNHCGISLLASCTQPCKCLWHCRVIISMPLH